MPELTLELLDSAVFLILGIAALTACFAGGRLIRLWLALAGIQAGMYLGLTYGKFLFDSSVHQLALAIVAGVLLAGLFSIFVRIGSLLAVGGTVVLLADLLLRILPINPGSYRLIIMGGAFLLGAIPGVFKFRVALVLATALNGGWLASFCAGGILSGWLIDRVAVEYAILEGSGLILMLIGTGVLLILGAIIQFKLTFRKQARGKPTRKTKKDNRTSVTPIVESDESILSITPLTLPESPLEMPEADADQIEIVNAEPDESEKTGV